jgi:hypothetical protein
MQRRQQTLAQQLKLSQQMLSQQMLSQQMLSQQMLSQQMLSQQMLSQQMLSQQMLSQPIQLNPLILLRQLILVVILNQRSMFLFLVIHMWIWTNLTIETVTAPVMDRETEVVTEAVMDLETALEMDLAMDLAVVEMEAISVEEVSKISLALLIQSQVLISDRRRGWLRRLQIARPQRVEMNVEFCSTISLHSYILVQLSEVKTETERKNSERCVWF